VLVALVFVGALAGLIVPGPARFGPPRAVAVVFAAAIAEGASVVAGGITHTVLLAASIVLAGLWIAVQRRHLASVLLAIGASLNVAVIASNGGMPVDRSALATVDRGNADVTQGFLYKHVQMTSDSHLAWLGDRIPVPIQRNVVSIGDVVIAVAISLWIADSVRAWRDRRRSSGTVDREHRGCPGGEVVGRCD
jgi:hypothetical protein